MSRESIEVVQRFFDAYVNGDYDRAASELHADAEWRNTPSFPGPTTVRGRKAIRDFWREMFRDFGGSSSSSSGMEVEKTADIDDLVLVEVHGWGGGTASAAPFDRRWAHVVRCGEGKVISIETYGSYRRAREVLGLQHESDST